MKITTLKERIEKAEETITKKQGTITKKANLIQKKQNKIFKTTDEFEIGCLKSDIEWLQEDIDRLHKEIEEKKVTLEKYKKQLAGEIEKESMFINEVPESMKIMEQQLVEEWDRFDSERKEKLKEEYKKVGYEKFIYSHSYADYELKNKPFEKIHQENVNFARQSIIDLINRIKDITGEVTDWSNVRLEQGSQFPVLNGKIKGKEGTAIVETILAGGYNIQRLHVRTLVHEVL